MSSDSDSDICDFSSDLNKFMCRANDKFRRNLKVQRNEKPPSDNVPEPQPKTQDLATSDEYDVAEKSTSLNEKPVENNHLIEIPKVTVSVETPSTSNGCGSIVNKLNELSETVQDNNQQGKKKKANRGRKRHATPARRWSAKSQVQNNIVPLLTVDSSDDEVTIEESSQNEITVPPVHNELNPTLEIKLLWKSSQNKVFKVKKFQALQCIHKYFINKAKVDPKLLFFTIDDRPVDLQDNSYVSLRLSDSKFIEGGVLPDSYLNIPVAYPKLNDKDLLKFKVQFVAGRKKEFIVTSKQSDTIEFILWQIVKEVKMPVENIRLYFDGQLLKASDTIIDLKLENEDCFDLQVI